MQVTINLSPSEAVLAASALDFVRRNLTLSADGPEYRLIGGHHFRVSIDEYFSLDYVADQLQGAADDYAERVRFAGNCRIF